MKNLKILILFIGFTGILFSSCYRDDSTLDVNEIAGVEIDTTGNSKLSVYQFEQLIVEPELKLNGLSESEVSYEWKINIEPGDTLSQVLSEERTLNTEILFKPNTSGENYQLVFTVTDLSTGLEYIMSWPLTVRNSIGEGLVIATTEDGVQADLSHVMSPLVTPDYSEVSIKYDVYSTNNNGDKLDGVIREMLFTNFYQEDVILAITDQSIIRINTFDYTFGGINADLFFGETPLPPQTLIRVPQGDIYIGNGKLTNTWLAISRQFGLPFDFSYTVPDHVAINRFPYPTTMLNFYDEVNEQFIYQISFRFGDIDMHPAPAMEDGPFNPASVTGKVNMAAVVNQNNEFVHLLKDKGTGDFALYVFDGGVFNYPDRTPPAPIALHDFSGAPDIENAEYFVLMDNQKVMYYATKTTIYAALYGTANPTFEERYSVPAGEEITTLQVYQQAGYPFTGEYLPTNNEQLVMSTFDGTEGKVYLLPITNIGVGNIDASNAKIYSGFDRITAITTQQ